MAKRDDKVCKQLDVIIRNSLNIISSEELYYPSI